MSTNTASKKSHLKWNKNCDASRETYEMIFRETFPDKSWDDSALTVGEFQQVIENIKDYANAVVKTAIELANDDYSEKLEKIKNNSMFTATTAEVVDEISANVPAVALPPAETPTESKSAESQHTGQNERIALYDVVSDRKSEIKKWAVSVGGTYWDETVCSFLVHHEKYDLFHTAKIVGYKCDKNVYMQLATVSDVVGLKWLHYSGEVHVCDVGAICRMAAAKGYLDVLKWARECFPSLSSDTKFWREAAQNGHLDIVQWYATFD